MAELKSKDYRSPYFDFFEGIGISVVQESLNWTMADDQWSGGCENF